MNNTVISTEGRNLSVAALQPRWRERGMTTRCTVLRVSEYKEFYNGLPNWRSRTHILANVDPSGPEGTPLRITNVVTCSAFAGSLRRGGTREGITNAITDDHLEHLAFKYFGSGRPVTWERMVDGVSTIVYRLERGTERFYLRILPEEGATFAPEVRTHQLARSLDCSVPEVLAYEARDPILGRSILLTTEIRGQPLSAGTEPAVAAEIIRAAGLDLARINSIPVDGFGWIDRESLTVEADLSARYADLSTLLASEYHPIVDQLPADAVPGMTGDVLRERLNRAMEIVGDGSASKLAHGDFDTTHIFENRGKYSGIIDFGEIRGMPPLYDLGHHLMHNRKRLPYSTIDWLIEGYGEIAPLPDDYRKKILAWSYLIATRALARGLQRDPDSMIASTARRCIARSEFRAEPGLFNDLPHPPHP